MEPNKSGKLSAIQDSMFKGIDREILMRHLRKNIIGDFSLFHTPFGIRPLVYADYVASGRSIEFIEKYLVDCVLPVYANTHTNTSYVGAQTGSLREEARHIIRTSLNGTDQDVILFAGSGSTGAINKMAQILKQTNWGTIQGFYGQSENGVFPCLACGEKFKSDGPFKKHIKKMHQQNLENIVNERPVVFVTIYEHHSNLLPWIENGADLVIINDDENGMLDIEHLKSELMRFSDRKFKIGSFSACSNVTGIVTDVVKVTDIMKEHGALVFFDYAGGAPYLVMDMNPKGHHAIDGIFLSGHKFVGGPGTPGILCVKRRLLGNSAPIQTGGGTVFFVSKIRHIYLENPEEKEEGGTPDILGAIRLGLVFHLKASIGDDFIMNTEFKHFKEIAEKLKHIPNFEILGSTRAKRIPIISFRIKHEDKFLHYGFISALLNDLFGIETRGGCACAGPYSQHLMDIPNDIVEKYNDYRLDGGELYIPGFSRLSVNYFFTDQVIEYIVESLEFVSKHAIWFLPLYKFVLHQKTPIFKHNKTEYNEIFSLRKLHKDYDKLRGQFKKKGDPADLKEYIKIAYKLLKKMQTRHISEEELVKESTFPEEMEELRWFVIPSEASQWALSKRNEEKRTKKTYRENLKPMSMKEKLKLPYIQKMHLSPTYRSTKELSANKILGKNGHSEKYLKETKEPKFHLDLNNEFIEHENILKDSKIEHSAEENLYFDEETKNTKLKKDKSNLKHKRASLEIIGKMRNENSEKEKQNGLERFSEMKKNISPRMKNVKSYSISKC